MRMDIWDEGNDGGDGASGPDRWGVGLAAAGGALIWAAGLYLAAHVIWALVR